EVADARLDLLVVIFFHVLLAGERRLVAPQGSLSLVLHCGRPDQRIVSSPLPSLALTDHLVLGRPQTDMPDLVQRFRAPAVVLRPFDAVRLPPQVKNVPVQILECDHPHRFSLRCRTAGPLASAGTAWRAARWG